MAQRAAENIMKNVNNLFFITIVSSIGAGTKARSYNKKIIKLGKILCFIFVLNPSSEAQADQIHGHIAYHKSLSNEQNR